MWLYNEEVSNHSKCKAIELKKKMICQYSNVRIFSHFDHEMTLTFGDLGDLFGRSPISMDYFYQISKSESVHIGVQKTYSIHLY